ncbi:MAG TPA: DUF262 domain-containing protein [Chitinophagales bacterium]|nr:DUF262 domain-containing protein [Chitinophagales bacterium]HNK90912.1 DUF262 domain-containing protein [Chitinophagales bacterium]
MIIIPETKAMTELENPRIRPVGDLLQENFFVPRYQRGYRWGKQEITELLDDILQYYNATQNRENKVSKFYCLQPVVVKKKEWFNNSKEKTKGWELIDGQQRLTTILLILNYLEDVRKLLNNNMDIYSIDFETRENCKPFFQDKTYKKTVDETNVDFYHISKAYEYINKWFEKNNHKVEILNTVLKSDYNVSIIWYEAVDNNQDNDDSSIELFTRLNDGKIPLTDAELIKALLLQADLYPTNEDRFVKQRLFEIATEWDDIEAKLQDEKFWLFLNDTNYQPSSKIEFIFKLLADKWNEFEKQSLVKYNLIDGKPKHYEFLVFDKYLSNKRAAFSDKDEDGKDILEPVNEIWKDIKEIFSIFYEWYNNHNLFHYIGFLLAIEKNKEELIRDLIDLKLTKTDFEDNIKNRIANSVKINKKDKESGIIKQLNQIAYGEDNQEIIKVLLLFNVDALVKHKKENAKFPFHLYKKEKITSIEHIHPQNPPSIDADEDRARIWLSQHKTSLSSMKEFAGSNKDEIDNVLQQTDSLLINYDKEVFKSLFTQTLDLYIKISGFKESELHTLYNLSLVDKDTNSQLNNSFFDIKREILKENKLGRYVPICTQRVFSKYYSNSSKEMIFWNNDDRQAYFKAIESVYLLFINLIGACNGN